MKRYAVTLLLVTALSSTGCKTGAALSRIESFGMDASGNVWLTVAPKPEEHDHGGDGWTIVGSVALSLLSLL